MLLLTAQIQQHHQELEGIAETLGLGVGLVEDRLYVAWGLYILPSAVNTKWSTFWNTF